MENKRSGNISIFNNTSTLYENSLFRDAFNTDDLEYLRSNHIPSTKDIFISTYPKCGTTWVGDICAQLTKHFSKKDDNHKYSHEAQYMALYSQSRDKYNEYINNTKDTLRFWKIHAPLKLLPIKTTNYSKNNDNNKIQIIVISRNPKDACVSFYFHKKNHKHNPFSGDFSLFFTLWTSGLIMSDTYFSWHKEWYDTFISSKNNINSDFNIHWIYYEDLKTNTRDEIIKLANFLGFSFDRYRSQCGDEKDKYYHIIDSVAKETSFKSREKHWNDEHAFFISKFLRKGVIGDWKNHFNQNQSKIIDYLIEMHFYNRPSFKYYQDLKSEESYILSRL